MGGSGKKSGLRKRLWERQDRRGRASRGIELGQSSSVENLRTIVDI